MVLLVYRLFNSFMKTFFTILILTLSLSTLAQDEITSFGCDDSTGQYRIKLTKNLDTEQIKIRIFSYKESKDVFRYDLSQEDMSEYDLAAIESRPEYISMGDVNQMDQYPHSLSMAFEKKSKNFKLVSFKAEGIDFPYCM